MKRIMKICHELCTRSRSNHFERGRVCAKVLAEDSLSEIIYLQLLLPVLIKCIDGTMEPACRFHEISRFSDSVTLKNVQV